MNGRKIVGGVLLLTAFVCAVLAAACADTGRITLYAPTNLQINADILTWDEVEHAEGYVVTINDTDYATETNYLDLFTLTASPDPFEISVYARGDFIQYNDSDQSEKIVYTVAFPTEFAVRSINDGQAYEIAAANDKIEGKLVIPNSIQGIPVTQIADRGFENCTGLTGVIFSKNLISVGTAAFYGCANLTRVEFNAGLFNIQSSAFFNTAVAEIRLPNTLNTIGVDAFGACPNLTSLSVAGDGDVFVDDGNCIIRAEDNALVVGCAASVIPDYVASIESGAFAGSGLTEITVPGNVQTVGPAAFSGCSFLEKVTIEEGVQSIGNPQSTLSEVFYSCSALKEINLPASVSYITGDMLSKCNNLEKIEIAEGSPFISDGLCIIRKEDNMLIAGCANSTIPDYVTGIGRDAFSESAIERAVLPASVKTIETCAFYHCTKLTYVYFPQGLTTIESSAFAKCSKLRFIAIPQSVTSIDSLVFYEDSALSVILPTSVQSIGNQAFTGATVYTSSPTRTHEGWINETNPLYTSLWAASCKIVYGCELGYDDGVPYVISFTYIPPSLNSSEYTVNGTNYFIPCREGYEFAGWATEENGEVVYESALVNGVTVTLTEEQKEIIPAGTTLYAVWKPAAS